MPSSDIRLSETSTQNTRGKNFQKFTCLNFHGFVFHGSYFRVFGRGSRKSRKFGARENFPLYGNCISSGQSTCSCMSDSEYNLSNGKVPRDKHEIHASTSSLDD